MKNLKENQEIMKSVLTNMIERLATVETKKVKETKEDKTEKDIRTESI